MTDKEIIRALECCSSDEAMICEECPLNEECYNDELPLAELALDIINRQQEQLEAAIAGQGTLQKTLAEKNAEIERRKNNLFCKVVIDEEEMRNIINEKVAEFELDIESIKSEAIKEFADLAIKAICEKVSAPTPTESYIVEKCIEAIDNLVKEMVGDAE